MSLARLKLLDFIRWCKEYFISWGLLSLIYSITLTILLQIFLELGTHKEFAFLPLWILSAVVLILPGWVEVLELPPLWLPKKLFQENFWDRPSLSFCKIYLRHELRRGNTGLGLFFSLFILSLLNHKQLFYSLFIVQLPLQRALYSVSHWKKLIIQHDPKNGARSFLTAILFSQIIQFGILWLALGVMILLGQSQFLYQDWVSFGLINLSAIVFASSLALEGDAGRPWLVNFISLAGGTLFGFLTLGSPLFVAIVIYFVSQKLKTVKNRLLSTEFIDEDTVIS